MVVIETINVGLIRQGNYDGGRQGGTVDWDKDRLKILVKTLASWSAQPFSTRPAAFLGFMAHLKYASPHPPPL